MKPAVMLPTYNEAENVAAMIESIFNAVPEATVVVVDDDSPDGTWKIVQGLVANSDQVRLIHRTEKRGRGYAGAAGFCYCVEEGFDPIIEMDADFSHDPLYLPELIAASKEYDVVLGSRGVEGGGESGRGLLRKFITWGAGVYLRTMLGVRGVKDMTSGYRCFRLEAMKKIKPETLSAPGPAIVSEVLFRCRKFRIKEIPIRFQDRAKGESKFGLKAMIESLTYALKLRLRGK
jgi:dolichol-phosphate mannosyltransferase